jgi:hypothetical protein
MKRAFTIAGRLSPDHQKEFIEYILSKVSNEENTIDLEPIGKKVGFSEREASSLAAAVISMVGLLSETKSSAEEFLEAARGKLYEEADRPAATFITNAVAARRKQLEASLERGSIAAETLPSFAGLDVSVDLRFKFDKEELKDAAPVAIIRISTDSRPEIWFQVSRADLAMILERLNQVSKQMDIVQDRFAGDRLSTLK